VFFGCAKEHRWRGSGSNFRLVICGVEVLYVSLWVNGGKEVGMYGGICRSCLEH
jgi:hypothetical protein